MSALSLGTSFVEKYLSSTGIIISKCVGLKDTIERITGDVVEKVPMKPPIYADVQLFIEKDMKITWEEINDIFAGSFKEDLEDRQVYVNIHKSAMYRVACRYPAFPCTDIIH